MLAAKSDDHEAFAVLFRRWQDPEFRDKFGRLGSDWHAADDATAITFADVFYRRDKFTAVTRSAHG